MTNIKRVNEMIEVVHTTYMYKTVLNTDSRLRKANDNSCICYVFTDAVKNIIQFLGMQPCERSDKVPEGKSSHTLYLAGMYRGGHDVLVRAKLALNDGVTMQITVRSTDPHASEVMANAVG